MIRIEQIKYGEICGSEEEKAFSFKGIPYATPPIFNNRWKKPQDCKKWEGVLDCTKFKSKCVQTYPENHEFYKKEFYDDQTFEVDSSEDCLFLNIWVPKEYSSESNYPVAVWYHGGAFLGGYSSEKEFDGNEYAARGIILVSVNYRVGVLGFLAHPWLAAEDENHISGNYGLYDQIKAIDWIRENIHNFGGDKDNITIFGQSAGSMSVQLLCCSKVCEDKFAKAILQSGGGYRSPLFQDINHELAMRVGEKFVESLNVKSIDELRKIKATEIVRKVSSFSFEKIKLPFSPIVDGYLIEEDQINILDKDRHLKIPYMIGSTKNDICSNKQMEKHGILPPLYQTSINWSLLNEKNGRPADFVYFFNHDLPGDDAGAFHSCELWYMFGTLGRSWRPNTLYDYELSTQMLDYWANFMKNSDPNGENLPKWYRCNQIGQYVKEFS